MPDFNTPITTYENFNINQAYMTPAYMANFRPAYNSQTSGNVYADNPSIFESMEAIFDPRYENPRNQSREQFEGGHWSNISNAPGDAFATAAQYVGIPLAAWGIANTAMGAKIGGQSIAAHMGSYGARTATNAGIGAVNSTLGRGARAAQRMGGGATMSSTMNATRTAYQAGGFRAAGRAALTGAGRVAAGGFGGGMMSAGGLMAGGMRAGAVAAGGIIGAGLIPLAAATGLAEVADAALIDPYIATRRGTDAMMANMQGQFVGGRGGQVVGGFGASNERANDIARMVTEAGQRDTTFSADEMQQISDFGMRAGLFQDIGNLDEKNMVDRITGMADTIKTIMAVADSDSVKDAVATMAKLRGAGLQDVTQMTQVMRQLGAASAVSGVSVDQLVNTVGNQGQMMAQQHGILPVIGQTAAANAYAGFANAQAAGIVSAGQIASLGGIGGMTQLSMQNGLQALQSPMGMMNLQTGNQFGSNPVQAMAQYGSKYANDPTRTMGDWVLNQGAYMGEALGENDPNEIMMNNVIAMARQSGIQPDDNGSYSIESLAAVAQSMGYSPEQIRTAAIAIESSQSESGEARRVGAINAGVREETMKRLNQEGLGMIGVPLIGDAQLAYQQFKSDFFGEASPIGDGITQIGASIADSRQRVTAWSMGMTMPEDRVAMMRDQEGPEVELANSSPETRDTIDKIRELQNSDDPKVKEAADSAMKLLSNEDASFEDVQTALAAVDTVSSGGIYGDEDAQQQTDRAAAISSDIEKGNIQAKDETITSMRLVHKQADKVIPTDIPLEQQARMAMTPQVPENLPNIDAEIGGLMGLAGDPTFGPDAEKILRMIEEKEDPAKIREALLALDERSNGLVSGSEGIIGRTEGIDKIMGEYEKGNLTTDSDTLNLTDARDKGRDAALEALGSDVGGELILPENMSGKNRERMEQGLSDIGRLKTIQEKIANGEELTDEEAEFQASKSSELKLLGISDDMIGGDKNNLEDAYVRARHRRDTGVDVEIERTRAINREDQDRYLATLEGIDGDTTKAEAYAGTQFGEDFQKLLARQKAGEELTDAEKKSIQNRRDFIEVAGGDADKILGGDDVEYEVAKLIRDQSGKIDDTKLARIADSDDKERDLKEYVAAKYGPEVAEQMFNTQDADSLTDQLDTEKGRERIDIAAEMAQQQLKESEQQINLAEKVSIDPGSIRDVADSVKKGFDDVGWTQNIMSNTEALRNLTKALNGRGIGGVNGKSTNMNGGWGG